jgi:hypothetical protein
MEDINKIRLIHEIKNGFSVDDTTLNKFIDQIDNSDYKDNIDRFFRGYKVEDNFHVLFSAMPWVKLIHALEQNQLPTLSKEIYQVPDFTIFYETNKKNDKPIFLEVKSVNGDSQSLEVMTKQLNACVEYSKIIGVPFLYAIYWEKYQTWTFNAVENFEVKTKEHKIKIIDAFKNDLSIIGGDIIFVISQPIYRRTICDKNLTDTTKAQHKKYGVIITDSVSIDNVNFVDLEYIESAVIDASIKMKIVNTEKESNITKITEVSDSNYFLKLSTLTLRHISIWGVELNWHYADLSRKVILELFNKLNIMQCYSIPNTKTTTSDFLYKQAFGESWILSNYSAT